MSQVESDLHRGHHDEPSLLVAPVDPATDRKWFLIAIAIIAALFLLLENKYWVPGGDSEVYLGSAINLAKGNGYMFNGQATKISPPGWPLVLAGLIKISPTFLFLKLATAFCMWAGLATFYFVLRRFASPKLCAAAIVITALISHVYSLTFWLHSDALFVWITATTLLVCLQIAEGRRAGWRCAALALLLIIAILNRWAALVNLAVIAGALLHGQARPKWNLQWVGFACAIALTLGTFVGLKHVMKIYAPPMAMGEETAVDPSGVAPPPDIGDVNESGNVSETPGIITGTTGRSGYGTRIAGFGTWFSFLLWQPFRMAGGIKAVFWVAAASGWIVFAFMLAGIVHATRRHHWLPATALIYSLALCLNWPQANARYLVPIAPLLVLVTLMGVRDTPIEPLRAFFKLVRLPDLHIWDARLRALPRAWKPIGVIGVASIVLCNASLYALEVSVARSSNFADRYEAGLNKSLIAAGNYLQSVHAGHWSITVNPEYRNMNKRQTKPTGLRIISMLTGKGIAQLPKIWMDDPKVPNSPPFRKQYLARHKFRYYLEQPEISPWRVWHFRMPWLQKMLTGHPPVEKDSRWHLYRCNTSQTPIEIPLQDVDEFPTRVPGF